MGINFKENQARLEQAGKITRDLERVLREQEHLISGTKAAAPHANESQVLLELAKPPIDRLKDATEETVRVETLRKYGFENVASVYNSSAIRLKRIPGITQSSAQSLKALNRVSNCYKSEYLIRHKSLKGDLKIPTRSWKRLPSPAAPIIICA